MDTQIKRLVDRLEIAKMSRADLARSLEVSPQVVQNWFARGKIPGSMLIRIAVLLQTNPAWLENGEGHPDQTIMTVEEPRGSYTVHNDEIMRQALEIADGVESQLGIKVNSDEKWQFIQNVAELLREKYTADNIPINVADIINITEAWERARRGADAKNPDNEPAPGRNSKASV